MQMDHLAVCKNMLWPFANIIYVVGHEVRPHTYLLYRNFKGVDRKHSFVSKNSIGLFLVG